jgi:hypothetical protein
VTIQVENPPVILATGGVYVIDGGITAGRLRLA